MCEGDVGVLWRATEPSAAAIGPLCHVILRKHVDAQRGSRGDVDAGGDGDPAAAAGVAGAIGGGEQVQQSGGPDGGVRDADWGDQHPDGDRCQPHIGGDVEEPRPRGEANKLQHLVLLCFPCRVYFPHILLVHHLLALSPKGIRSCSLFLSEQSPLEEGPRSSR